MHNVPLEMSADADNAGRLLAALRARGVRRVRGIRLKRNRTRLLSLSRDGATLHMDAVFGEAPAAILDAIADYLLGGRRARAGREAAAAIRAWGAPRQAARAGARGCGGRASVEALAPRVGPCCATPAQRRYLTAQYHRLNVEHFGGRLPEHLPVRLSSRMTRRLGHVRYFRSAAAGREVVEIALNPDLLLDGNEAELRGTLLHEMAHVEAWLEHGHAGHGAPWRRVACRVGCEPRACTRVPVHRRARGAQPPAGVPADPAEPPSRGQ